jgi:UDP-N-acetylglucosamine:LPS N-acetylglucosamine transferase
MIIGDAELTGELLAGTLATLLDDAGRRDAMSKAMQGWSKPNAAADAAGFILEIAKKKETGAVTRARQAA